MISLTSATKRTEEFAAAVDGRTAQDDLRADLAELVEMVGALRATEVPTPRPDFVTSLRERLLVEAETALTRDAPLTLPPRRKSRERRLAVAASAFVLVGGTAGMAAAAQNALPGDALYPIKRGIESAQADFSSGQESRGQRLLDQADSRLAEVQGLLAGDGNPAEVTTTLDDFVSQANEGSDLLLGTFADEQDPATVDEVRDFTSQAMDSLAALSALAPADLQDEFSDAAGALQQIDQQASAACSTCADKRPALKLASVFSSTEEAQRALEALSGSGTPVNNDHPTIGGIKAPGADDATSGSGGATGGGDSTGGGVTGDDGGGVLGDLGDTVGGLTGDSGASEGGLQPDKVKDTVKDTVQDVLPDPLDPPLDQLLP